jgi:hypothetical protein
VHGDAAPRRRAAHLARHIAPRAYLKAAARTEEKGEGLFPNGSSSGVACCVVREKALALRNSRKRQQRRKLAKKRRCRAPRCARWHRGGGGIFYCQSAAAGGVALGLLADRWRAQRRKTSACASRRTNAAQHK